jgi:hypothetical protein
MIRVGGLGAREGKGVGFRGKADVATAGHGRYVPLGDDSGGIDPFTGCVYYRWRT